jgi:hypothetical protein
MSSPGAVDKNILQVTTKEISIEDLKHISPLHRIIAEELIASGRLKLVKTESEKAG